MYSDGQVISEKTLNVRVGTGKKVSATDKQYNVKTLIVHEDYSQNTYENDIALMKLKETLDLSKKFKAICFSQLGNLPFPEKGIAVGYGSTDKSESSVHSEVLRNVDMPIANPEECLDSDSEFFSKHLFAGNFCAGEIGVMKGVSGTNDFI